MLAITNDKNSTARGIRLTTILIRIIVTPTLRETLPPARRQPKMMDGVNQFNQTPTRGQYDELRRQQNAPQSKLDRNTTTTKAMGYSDGCCQPIQHANDPWGNTMKLQFRSKFQAIPTRKQ
jgi:hypothetical protein